MRPTGIIPVGDLLRQLILAVGAALALANLAVVVRERRRDDDDPRPKPNMRIVYVNLAIGSLIAFVGLASILAARG